MKNFKLLMTFALCLAFGVSYGQIKVITSGDVGIGESNPAADLHINHLEAGPSSFIVEKAPNFVRAAAGAAGTAFYFNQNTFFSLAPAPDIATNGVDFTKSLTVYGAGHPNGAKVGIGTNAPTEQLEVLGNVKANGVILSSDKRLKRNVSPFDIGLDAVMQLNPINFEYNGQGGTMNGATNVGIYAQELQEVAPSMVKEYTHRTFAKTQDVDQQMRVSNEENFLSIKDNEIKWMLVNAIKEQQEMISAMETKIAELEASISRADAGSSQSVSIASATLAQNAPNPFNQSTVINYAVPTKASNATLQIFDLNGSVLKTVNLAKGNGQVTINAGELAAGTYSYNLVVDGNVVDTKKMVLTK